jgi:single-strand DNA-binding protein
MHLHGLARLGRDIELRVTQDGTPVGNLALAFNYGRKGQDGKRPTQWIDASLWGDRVEKLQSYLVKGTQISVILSDPHVETYEKKDGGTGVKLVARVDGLEFASSPREAGEQRSAAGDYQAARETRAPAPKPAAKADFSDLDSDIPF